MRILALSDRAALEPQSGQVRYANCFPEVEVNLRHGMTLHQIERALVGKDYDGVFLSSAIFDLPTRSSECPTLWDVLHYQKKDYIGSRADDFMLLQDKALSSWRSGMELPGQIITRFLWEHRKDEALKRMRNLGTPLTLESNLTSAPITGLTVHSEAEAVRAADSLFRRTTQLTEILVRRYPNRFERYTVFVFGNGDSLACWPVVSTTYAAVQGNTPELAEQLAHCARTAAQKFSVRDYCQIDFLVDTSRHIYFTAVDPAPNLTRLSTSARAKAFPFRSEQVLTLLLLIFAQRTGHWVPDCLFYAFPRTLLGELGF